MGITLEEIRLQARQRADMTESQFVTDSELNSYINSSMAELHDLLIAAYNEEYYMNSIEFISVINTIEYDLPDGTNYTAAPKFYKLRGVDVKLDNNDWSTVKRFNFNRRNEDVNNFGWNLFGVEFLEYRLVGSKIRFNQTPTQNVTFRIWYHPSAEVLVDDDDEFQDINGYVEYVIVDAAIKMMQKEESDVTVLMLQKQALNDRIKTMAQNRDANEPESVSDIYAEDANIFWGRR